LNTSVEAISFVMALCASLIYKLINLLEVIANLKELLLTLPADIK